MKPKDPAPTAQELLDELKALAVEAETLLTTTLSEHSAEALDNLRVRFESAQERFSTIYRNAQKQVIAGAKFTDEKIRENPYQSVAIAAGVGLLLGVVLTRGRR